MNDAEIRKVFASLDLDGNGSLSADEVTLGIRSLGLATTMSSTQHLMTYIDTNGDGKISYEEFEAFYRLRYQELRAAYEDINQWTRHERKGFSPGALRRSAHNCGILLTRADVDRMMAKLDLNKDGMVTFDEFLTVMLLVPPFDLHAFFDNEFLYSLLSDDVGSVGGSEVERGSDETFFSAAIKKLAGGGVAAAISRTLTAPLDRLRVVMMTSPTRIGLMESFRVSISDPRYGYRGLWVGNGTNCAKVAPEMGIKLFAFDAFKDMCSRDPLNATPLERFTAGALAGSLATCCVYPMEVVRTKLGMVNGQQYNGMIDCLQKTYASGGVRALYSGLTPNLLGIVPYAGMDLALNSYLQDSVAVYLGKRDKHEVAGGYLLMCGMISSVVSTSATFPLYVLRTKLQATGGSLVTVTRELYAKEGMKGMFRGYVPSVVKIAPASAIAYTVYEFYCRTFV